MKSVDSLLILSLFCGYAIKAAVLGASAVDAAIILTLGAANFLHNHHVNNKKLTELNQQLNKLNTEIALHNVAINDVKTSMTSIKLAS
jgi:hypothetical protein